MILVVDNYDSFTFNLVQYLAELGAEVVVRRNDAVSVDEVAALEPEALVLSPGPGGPDAAGITLEVVARYGNRLPMLGVCLGHQCLAQAFGARIERAPRLMHGRTSLVEHDGRGLFRGLRSPLTATRYHSLAVERASVPPDFEVSAWTDAQEIMGLRHLSLPLEGIQFHPESFLTEHGHAILQNFLTSLPDQGAKPSGLAGTYRRAALPEAG